MQFLELVQFFESISTIKVDKDIVRHKKDKIEKLFHSWFHDGNNNAVRKDVYPILRLLLPAKDRRLYQMKEAKLAKCIIDSLGISDKSSDAQKLINFQIPDKYKNDQTFCDFAQTAYFIIKPRCRSSSSATMSIDEINQQLDSMIDQKQATTVMSKLMAKLCPVQIKWLIRIILKDLRIGLYENLVLEAVHPDAVELSNCVADLQKFAELIIDRDTKSKTKPTIFLFIPFRPMLSDKIDLKSIEHLMDGNQFYIETKYDGERFQMHKNENEYRYFSRNCYNYSRPFGKTSSEGTLTQYIHDCFDESVKKVILDGEMCTYKCKEKVILTKAGTNDIKSDKLDENIQPCFVVFDILMFNDIVLLDYPLKERLKYLRKAFKVREGRMIVSNIEIGHKNQQAIDALNRAIDTRLEGIMIKDPESIYQPNLRVKSGFYKIKPDHLFGLSDDLDLLIIGGSYGSGSKSGKISKFLIAVHDVDNGKYYPIGRVGTGYTFHELDDFNRKLEERWKKFDQKNAPKNYVIVSEYPDVWISPEDSFIVQVKAAEIIPSEPTRHKIGLTLRFPRLQKIRTDKNWSECMTASELKNLYAKTEGKLATKRVNDENNGEVKVKRVKIETPKKMFSFRFDDEKGDFFKGHEICILNVDDGIQKDSLECFVVANGGKIVKNPGETTTCIITSKLIHRVKQLIAKDIYDVVSTDWLLKCLKDKKFHPWTPLDVFHATEKTRKQLTEKFDKYGDAFYQEKTSKSDLEAIFSNMKNIEICDSKTISSIEEEYFPDATMTNGLFRLCSVYFDMNEVLNDEKTVDKDSKLYLTKLKFKDRGGIVCEQISDLTTHCVLDKNGLKRYDEIEKLNHQREKKYYIVSSEWIDDCIEKKRLLDERLDYLLFK